MKNLITRGLVIIIVLCSLLLVLSHPVSAQETQSAESSTSFFSRLLHFVQQAWNPDSRIAMIVLIGVLGMTPLVFKVLRSETWLSLSLLTLIVVGGLILRVKLTQGSIMASCDYTRHIEIERVLHGFWILGLFQFDWIVKYWDFVFLVNLAYGTLTVLLYFVHVKLWMKDSKVALTAAFILATLPAHIKFSNTNVQFIPSMFWASLSFIGLHYLAKSPTIYGKIYTFTIFITIFYYNFFTRFLNILFFPLFIAVFCLLYVDEIKKKGIYLYLLAVYFLLGTLLTIEYIRTNPIAEVMERLSIFTQLISVFSPNINSFLNYTMSPPWIPLLALWGAWRLWKTNLRWLGILVVWYFMFFYTHSLIIMPPLGQARYNLHMTAPVIIIAAVGLWQLPKPKITRPIALAFVALTPLIYYHFLVDYHWTRLREFLFLDRNTHLIESGSVALEADVMQPQWFESKLLRAGEYFDFSRRTRSHRFTVIPYKTAEDFKDVEEGYYYQGAICYTWQPGENGQNPVCELVSKYYDMEPLAKDSFMSETLNPVFSVGVDWEVSIPIELALYKMTRKRNYDAVVENMVDLNQVE